MWRWWVGRWVRSIEKGRPTEAQMYTCAGMSLTTDPRADPQTHGTDLVCALLGDAVVEEVPQVLVEKVGLVVVRLRGLWVGG